MVRLNTFLSCCLSICYLASWSLSFSVDYEKEKTKIRERLGNLTDPAEREAKLLQIAVEDREEERARAEKYKEEVGGLKIEKDRIEAEAKKYKIPLMIRSFATMIEDEFPELKGKSYTPQRVKKLTPKHSQHRVDRIFRFKKILQVGLRRNNEYVICLMKDVDDYFKKEKKITNLNKRSKLYDKYIFRFCDSIVKATEHGNRYMAHLFTGGGVKLDVLGVYDKVVDEHMVIFYNSLVATDMAEKAVQKIEDEIKLGEVISEYV